MNKTKLLLSLIVVVMALNACGSNDKKSDSNESKSNLSKTSINALTAAADASEKAKSYSFEATSTISGKIAGQNINGSIKMNGSTSADGKTSVTNIDMSSLLSGFSSLLGSGGNYTMEQRVIDGVSYTRNPDLFGSGKEYWVKTDISQFLEAQQSQNPNQYLQYLKATSGDVKKVGKETVNGVETTHYKATIKSNDIIKKFDSKEWKNFYNDQGVSDSDYEKIKSAYKKGISDIPVDVWVGSDERPVKMKLKTNINVGAFTSGLTQDSKAAFDSEFEILFTNWGVDVKVELPPADKIVTQKQYDAQVQQDMLSRLQS
ncbi:MAG: hypothetical protein U0R17_04645 [Acidimicrobiia bacterium]